MDVYRYPKHPSKASITTNGHLLAHHIRYWRSGLAKRIIGRIGLQGGLTGGADGASKGTG